MKINREQRYVATVFVIVFGMDVLVAGNAFNSRALAIVLLFGWWFYGVRSKPYTDEKPRKPWMNRSQKSVFILFLFAFFGSLGMYRILAIENIVVFVILGCWFYGVRDKQKE